MCCYNRLITRVFRLLPHNPPVLATSLTTRSHDVLGWWPDLLDWMGSLLYSGTRRVKGRQTGKFAAHWSSIFLINPRAVVLHQVSRLANQDKNSRKLEGVVTKPQIDFNSQLSDVSIPLALLFSSNHSPKEGKLIDIFRVIVKIEPGRWYNWWFSWE